MKMISMSIQDLNGVQLAWALASCIDTKIGKPFIFEGKCVLADNEQSIALRSVPFSITWSKVGKLIKSDQISVEWNQTSGYWAAYTKEFDDLCTSDDPVIAAAKCYIRMKNNIKVKNKFSWHIQVPDLTVSGEPS